MIDHLKQEKILDEELFIKFLDKNHVILTDENDLFEIMYDSYKSINISDNHFDSENEFIKQLSKLNSNDQNEKYNTYVKLFDFDKRLIEDENSRKELAKEGKYLFLLVKDNSSSVRCAVAKYKRKKDLYILINDEDEYIRNLAIKLYKNKNK